MNAGKRRILVAKFRNLKLAVLGQQQVVRCSLWIEARASSVNPDKFFLHWQANGSPVTPYPYSLREAQQVARAMFVEQLEPWTDQEISRS